MAYQKSVIQKNIAFWLALYSIHKRKFWDNVKMLVGFEKKDLEEIIPSRSFSHQVLRWAFSLMT